jgi:DNA-directed RNA polymerase I, II, and III subunit RPABC2
MSKFPAIIEEKDGESVVSDDDSDNESDYEDKEDDVEDVADDDEDAADDDEDADNEDAESVNSAEMININSLVEDEPALRNVGANMEPDLDEEMDTSYQKLEDYMILSDLEKMHPESQCINFDEVAALTRVVRDANAKIIDPLHKTAPFITKYEKARIIGARAEQIERGAMPFVEVDSHIINARTIAMMEYDLKKIPFIIARPLPNKTIEYWKLQDLEFL